jgi:stage II sporulation protein E
MNKVIKVFKRRDVWINLVGVILARAVIFSMNPIAMGFFAAMYAEKTGRLVVVLGTIIGMATVMSSVDIIKYALVMLVVIIITALTEYNKRRICTQVMGLLAGIITTALSITKGFLYVNYQYYVILAILEGILIWVISIIFHKGIHYFLYAKKGQLLKNEELISMAVILSLISYAAPTVLVEDFSLGFTLAYLFVAFMGYKYGAGSGAVAGAACGLVIGLGSGVLNVIGIMCILGICAGMFREIGRFGTGIVFLIVSISLGFVYENTMLGVEQIRALTSGVVLFILFPKRFLYPLDLIGKRENENSYAKEKLQTITKNKLHEFSDSFQMLSKTFYKIADTKNSLSRKDVENVFEELSDRLCRDCIKYNYCWKNNYYSTYQAAYSIVGIVDKNGEILESDIPENFARKCINIESFIKETQRSLEMAKLNLGWNNRMAESREAIAGQFGEVANIIKDFAADIYETQGTPSIVEEKLINKLRTYSIDTKKLAVFEKRGGKLEVYLTAKTKKGRCIRAKEAAMVIGQVLGRRFRPSEGTKNIIPKEYETLVFVEDVNFKILSGVARRTKKGEDVSGDNFSFIHLNSGEMIMTLSDGMGSGEEAHEESESVVELLEHFIEAGFKETSAIRLINSVLVLKSNNHFFSTVDMSVINLFTGMCKCIKAGATATFIKRNKWVETICSTSMPIGIFNQVDMDGVSKKLYDGDFVVMMTDGVVDSFPGNHKEKYIENILMTMKSNNPKEIANLILKQALLARKDKVLDDMTVMVVGMWEKVC